MTEIAKGQTGRVSETSKTEALSPYPFRKEDDLETAFKVLLAMYAGIAGEVLSSDKMQLAKFAAARHAERMGVTPEDFERHSDELLTYWFRRRQANPMSSMMP